MLAEKLDNRKPGFFFFLTKQLHQLCIKGTWRNWKYNPECFSKGAFQKTVIFPWMVKQMGHSVLPTLFPLLKIRVLPCWTKHFCPSLMLWKALNLLCLSIGLGTMLVRLPQCFATPILHTTPQLSLVLCLYYLSPWTLSWNVIHRWPSVSFDALFWLLWGVLQV